MKKTYYLFNPGEMTRKDNSVFEGEISEVKLKELLQKANGFLDKTEDSIILFKHPTQIVMEKEVIGNERCSTDIFL